MMLDNQSRVDQYPVSISDIQDRYFDGKKLTDLEMRAMQNFNKFRLDYLESAESEKDFEKRYFELQIKANLSSYEDFLD